MTEVLSSIETTLMVSYFISVSMNSQVSINGGIMVCAYNPEDDFIPCGDNQNTDESFEYYDEDEY